MISGILVKIISIVLLIAVGLVLILGIGTLFKGGKQAKNIQTSHAIEVCYNFAIIALSFPCY